MKQKTCAKGYSCGNACIAKGRNCKQKAEPKVDAMVSKVVAAIQSEPSGQPTRPKSKAESDKLGKAGKAKLYDQLIDWQPKGPLTADEREQVADNMDLPGPTISRRMNSYQSDYVNGLIGDDEDSQRQTDAYNGMKKYQATAPKPSGPLYMRLDSIVSLNPGSTFNDYSDYIDLSKKIPGASKGKYLVTIEDNKNGFEALGDNNRVLSDRQYEVVSVKGNNVVLKEKGKGKPNKAAIGTDGFS